MYNFRIGGSKIVFSSVAKIHFHISELLSSDMTFALLFLLLLVKYHDGSETCSSEFSFNVVGDNVTNVVTDLTEEVTC